MASGNKVLQFFIRARDEATSRLSKVKNAVAKMADAFKSAAEKIGRNLTNIKSGFDLLKGTAQSVGGAIRRFWDSVVAAMQYEALEKKWAMLLHDADRARRFVADLQKLGETPPFSREQFSAAAQSLNTFGGAALVNTKLLTDLGDTAYRTGNSVESVADVVGRAYAVIRDGQPLSRMKMQLVQMGIVTPEVAAQLEKMGKEGTFAAAQWDVLRNALAQSKGAMDSAMQTGDGLLNAVKGSWSGAVQEFGAAFLDLAKNELAYLLDTLKRFREDGSIQKWANTALEAIKPLVEAFGNLFDGESREITLDAAWEKMKSVFTWAWDSLANILRTWIETLYEKALYSLAKRFMSREDREFAERNFGYKGANRQGEIDEAFHRRNAEADARIAAAAEERRRRAAEKAANAAREKEAADAERQTREGVEAESAIRAELEEADRKAREKADHEASVAANADEEKSLRAQEAHWDRVADELEKALDPEAWDKTIADLDRAIENAKKVRFTEDQFASNREIRAQEKAEAAFERRVERLRDRQERGQRLSRRDLKMLEAADRRDAAVQEAQKAKADAEKRHREMLEKQERAIGVQNAIKDALEKNFQEQQKLMTVKG